MPSFKLPRLRANLSIVNKDGKPLDYFLRLINIEMAQRIEAAILDLQAVTTTLAEQQEQLDSQQQALENQLSLINQALELAGIAIGLAGGNVGTATATLDITGTSWEPGPQVDLTGVVAGDLTVSSSGLYPDSGTDFNFTVERFGQVRLIEVDGVTESVIGGPWSMRVIKDALLGTVFIENPLALNSFTASLTTTGNLGYRLEYLMDEPLDLIENVPAKMLARRTT